MDACSFLSSRKIGALIAIERQESLRVFPGRPINASLSSEMIITIFNPASPLHDGGVIIKNDVIVSAGCFFPISTDLELGTELGTRHRAAIELSRETDAVVVIVSEETGKISLAADGELKRIASDRLLKPSLVSELTAESPSGIKIGQTGKADGEKTFFQGLTKKTIALALAVILWAFTNFELDVERDVRIPLHLGGLPEDLIIVNNALRTLTSLSGDRETCSLHLPSQTSQSPLTCRKRNGAFLK